MQEWAYDVLDLGLPKLEFSLAADTLSGFTLVTGLPWRLQVTKRCLLLQTHLCCIPPSATDRVAFSLAANASYSVFRPPVDYYLIRFLAERRSRC